MVKKKRKKKRKKKKTAYLGGGSSSLYSLNSVGGGKATLKDRGDVVLAGTRRVFVHVARKENFPISVPYIVGTFERKREGNEIRK